MAILEEKELRKGHNLLMLDSFTYLRGTWMTSTGKIYWHLYDNRKIY